jgi:hypothetical protein
MAMEMVAARTQVAVDWPQLFKDFCELHGEPVVVPGKDLRLLFADGWVHACDHRGPIWPPPDDPFALRNLREQYWSLRKGMVVRELNTLENLLDTLGRLGVQRGCHTQGGVPIAMRFVRGVEGGHYRLSEERLRVTGEFQAERLAWLREDLGRCDAELGKLAAEQLPAAEPAVKAGELLEERDVAF